MIAPTADIPIPSEPQVTSTLSESAQIDTPSDSGPQKPVLSESIQEESETSIAIDPADLTEVWRNYAEETVRSFNSAAEFARALPGGFSTPEILLIGQEGAGKSLLLEALLGHPVCTPGATKRPLSIQLINTSCLADKSLYEQPKITVKRDAHLQREFPSDVIVTLPDMPAEISKRSTEEVNSIPIQVVFQWNYCTNLTIFDTPGLTDWQSQDERSKIVTELAKDANRILIFVEKCKPWSQLECLEMANRVDSVSSRSIFVMTSFWEMLKNFPDQSSVNNFLTKKPSADMKTFFVSLMSRRARDESMSTNTFQNRVVQNWKRDMKALEKLKFDRAEEDWIGIHQLRMEILKSNYSFYKDALVTFRKSMASRKKKVEANISALEDQMNIDPPKIRWLMSTYVSEWVQIMIHFMDGTHEGGTNLYGQTLREENEAAESQPWRFNDQDIDVDRHEFLTPEPGMERMAGGDQFGRLLAFFRQIFTIPELATVSEEDIVLALANLNDQGNFSDSVETSTKIVQMHIKNTFEPLLEQLAERAMQVVKRLADIGFQVISTSSKKLESSSRKLYGFSMINGFTQFQGCIRDVFYDYVELVGRNFREKCRDEMSSTRYIIHHFTSIPVESEKFHLVQSLCNQLLLETKQYLLRNIVLKAHRSFVSQMQQNVNSEVMKNVATFSDSFLDEMFDLKATRDGVRLKMKKQEAALSKIEDSENELRDLVSQFARMKLVNNGKLNVLQNITKA